jgi:hypothetical protein
MGYTWNKKNATTVEMVASTAAAPGITVSWPTTNGWTVTAGGQTSSVSPIELPGAGTYELTVSNNGNQNVSTGPTPTQGNNSSVAFGGGTVGELQIQLQGSPMGL